MPALSANHHVAYYRHRGIGVEGLASPLEPPEWSEPQDGSPTDCYVASLRLCAARDGNALWSQMYAACAAEGLLEKAGTGLVRPEVWLRTTVVSSDLCGYEWTIGRIAGQLHHLDAGGFPSKFIVLLRV